MSCLFREMSDKFVNKSRMQVIDLCKLVGKLQTVLESPARLCPLKLEKSDRIFLFCWHISHSLSLMPTQTATVVHYVNTNSDL